MDYPKCDTTSTLAHYLHRGPKFGNDLAQFGFFAYMDVGQRTGTLGPKSWQKGGGGGAKSYPQLTKRLPTAYSHPLALHRMRQEPRRCDP